VAPAVNQIEMHHYFANDAARAASTRHGIAVEAWSPLGQGKVLADPVIGRIAAARGKSTAQVILRWHIQQGPIISKRRCVRTTLARHLAPAEQKPYPASGAGHGARGHGTGTITRDRPGR
jgi:2,5-diketo-D-gluconate reductase A